jgi:hypothetical protein
MTDPDDDVDALLTPRPGSPSAELRDALLRQTSRRLLWARRLRQALTATAAAVLFAGGLAAGWYAKPVPSPAPVPTPEPETVTVPVPVVIPVPTPVPADESRPASPAEVVTAPQAELKAELADDPAEAARLYRLAGDKYLTDRQDHRNAARCYRLFLARAGDAGLSPDPADTWLLTSLKNAAFKEKYDAAAHND